MNNAQSKVEDINDIQNSLTTQKKSHTLMYKEASETSEKISEQVTNNQKIIQVISNHLQQHPPASVMIVGRGSSDHAGVFAKYLIEVELGIPTFAAAPSVSSIYNQRLKLKDSLVIIISQSGRSPDILEQARQAKAAGAFCIALLNDREAPLSTIADYVVPLSVGKEKSVAATKSFLGTLSALLQLIAYWKKDETLISAINLLPEALTQALKADAQIKLADLNQVSSLVVLGRGFGYAVSKEIALKIKEVCALHAEAFSSAEFLHGPVAILKPGFKVIDVSINDESSSFHQEQIREITHRGADLLHLHQILENIHPRIAPLILLQRFYLDIEKIALQRGLDPDNPKGLKKVTETI